MHATLPALIVRYITLALLLSSSAAFSLFAARQPGYGDLPLYFEENRGQAPSEVKYVSHGAEFRLDLSNDGAALRLSRGGKSSLIRIKLHQSRSSASLQALEVSPATTNYFVGSDPSLWRTGIPNYGKIRYAGVYPGVDLVYHGNHRQLEYDFVVAPGASVRPIDLEFAGAHRIFIDRNADLVILTPAGDLRQHPPRIYQEIAGQRVERSGHYVLRGHNRVGFAVPDFDHTAALVIDPILSYSSYLGGSNSDFVTAIAVDGSGSAYLAGATSSQDFPTTMGSYQSTPPSAFGSFVFITKVNPAGNGLVYSTYLGPSPGTNVSLAVDSAGNAYVTGYTYGNFPLTVGAYKTTFSGQGDVFVSKLSATGASLVYSTVIGQGQGAGLAVDNTSHIAYVTGSTFSMTFPVTVGAYQTSSGGNGDAFVTALDATGSTLVYSTFLGGSGVDTGSRIALDGAGQAIVAGNTAANTSNGTGNNFPTTAGSFQPASTGGQDAFIARFKPDGSGLIYSSYLGGSGTDAATGLAVDPQGNVYVTGTTQLNYNGTNDFPVTSSAFDILPATAFVTKISPAGNSLIYSTYFPGSNNCYSFGYICANRIAVDGSGKAYIAGSSSGSDVSATSDALQQSPIGNGDAFVAVLDPSGAYLTYATFFGGSNSDSATDIALDTAGGVYIAGITTSSNLPIVNGFQSSFSQQFGTHSFVAKILMDSTVCFVNINTMTQSFPYAGGNGSLTVTAPPGCPWSASIMNNYNPPVITITGSGAGVGSGTLNFTVARNFSSFTRGATLTVGSQNVSILQAAAPCIATFLPPASPLFPGGGGVSNVGVSIPTGCSWSVVSDSSWVVAMIHTPFGSGNSSNGSAAVRYIVAANNGPARTATLSMNGEPYQITQQASMLLVSPTTVIVDANAHSGTITVSTNASAGPWSAFSEDPWITITSSATGNGAGSVTYSVAANNTGAPRVSALLIAGATVAVTQREMTQLFADVQPADYYFDGASLLRADGITAGCTTSPLQFCPADNVTLGQMAIFIVRGVMGGDNFTYTQKPYFTDVPGTHPYFAWIQKLRDLGFTSGCTATTYCPDAPATRGQAAGLLMKARLNGQNANGCCSQSFTDVPFSDPNYFWIQAMHDQGIAAGCTPTTFCPNGTITRGQVAILLVRALFNQMLPDNTPVITSVSPNTISRGQTTNVTITGRNVVFPTTPANGYIYGGMGVTFGAAVATTANSITLPVTVDNTAAIGPRTISTPVNNGTAYGPNLLIIQ